MFILDGVWWDAREYDYTSGNVIGIAGRKYGRDNRRYGYT